MCLVLLQTALAALAALVVVLLMARQPPRPNMPLFMLPPSVASATIVAPERSASTEATWMPLSEYRASHPSKHQRTFIDAASLCSSEPMCSMEDAANASPTRAPRLGYDSTACERRWCKHLAQSPFPKLAMALCRAAPASAAGSA